MDENHSFRYWGDETPEDAAATLPPPEIIISKPPKPRIGLGLPSMILGIITFCFFWIPFISIPTGIVAIIFGITALCKKCAKGYAIAGLATAGASLAFLIYLIVAVVSTVQGGFIAGNPGDGFSFSYEYESDDFIPDLIPELTPDTEADLGDFV